MAEATGVFFYVLPGCGAITTFTLAGYSDAGKELGVPSFGGIMPIGLAFGLGIAFAIITCAATSGGVSAPCLSLRPKTLPIPKLVYDDSDQSLTLLL